MGVRDDELTHLTDFAGLNNLAKETALTLRALREADNVVLDRNGKLRSRDGYGAPLVACSNGHSLWAERTWPFALYADAGALHAFDPSETARALATGLTPGLPLSYARINDAVVWSNGAQRGEVRLDGSVGDWACPSPGSQPALTVRADGGLHPGEIKVACTFVDARGRESGTGPAARIRLDAAGSVQVDNLPQPDDALAVPFVRVYASSGNDATLYLAAQLPAGLTSYSLMTAPRHQQCATQFLRPLPPGQLVRYWDGRQLVATGNLLRWSPALRYGLTDPRKHYLRFHARIDVLEPVGDGTDGAGVYVCAGDTTYYLTGADPAEWKQSIPYPVGAVADTSYPTPADAWGIQSKVQVPAWLARNGLTVVGLPGGQVVTFNDDTAIAATGERGASIFLEADGVRQFLTTLRGASLPRLAVTDKAVARLYREDGTLAP